MRVPRLSAAILLVLLASACAGRSPAEDQPAVQDAPAGETRHQATVTVLQDREKPAQMCWNVLTSLPPQCGDVPITNWSWDDVEGEERMNGVVWGEYHLIGTYDGEAFTALETGPPRDDPSPEHPIDAPCPEPEGGWQSSDLSKASEGDVDAVTTHLHDIEHAGLWIDYLGDPPAEESMNAGRIVLTVAFTEDPESHRAELEEIWGGPLCLVEFGRSMAELQRIQREVGGDETRFQVLSSSIDVTRNRVEATVVLAEPADQAALDARYGLGAVVLESALQPAD